MPLVEIKRKDVQELLLRHRKDQDIFEHFNLNQNIFKHVYENVHKNIHKFFNKHQLFN